MNKMWGVLAVIIIIIGIILVFADGHKSATVTNAGVAAPTLAATADYACDAQKSLTAAYYDGPAATSTSADAPPTPTGSVQLSLSDGRSLTLPQVISADGGKYSNADGSLTFWSKGSGAMVMESGTTTFANCAQVAADPGQLPETYKSDAYGFTIRIPQNYKADESYKYQALGPKKSIGGVKFTIDPSIATGTNLSADSYISVEQLSNATSTCDASTLLDKGEMSASSTMVTDGNTDYSVASSSDAGAGNRYLETVYALTGTSPCMAVRYFVHYGVLENYPVGKVKAYDAAALQLQFDAIRRTLTISQ